MKMALLVVEAERRRQSKTFQKTPFVNSVSVPTDANHYINFSDDTALVALMKECEKPDIYLDGVNKLVPKCSHSSV